MELESVLSFSSDISPGYELLNHTVIRFLLFWGPSIMSHIMAASVYIPTKLHVDLSLQPWLWTAVLLHRLISARVALYVVCSLICSSGKVSPLSSYCAILSSLFIFVVSIVIGNLCAEGQAQAKLKFSGLSEPAPLTIQAWRLLIFCVYAS